MAGKDSHVLLKDTSVGEMFVALLDLIFQVFTINRP